MSLRITDDQMQILRADRRTRFEDRVAEHVKNAYPDVTFELDDQEIRSRVHAAVERAAAYGLRSEVDVVTYVDLSFDLGDGFESHVAWAAEIFDEPGVAPSERVRRLRRVAFGI
jgi:hypothetical protein